MKISVAGTGYVGMSIATLLAQHNEVIVVDIVRRDFEKKKLLYPFVKLWGEWGLSLFALSFQ